MTINLMGVVASLFMHTVIILQLLGGVTVMQ